MHFHILHNIVIVQIWSVFLDLKNNIFYFWHIKQNQDWMCKLGTTFFVQQDICQLGRFDWTFSNWEMDI